MPFVAGIEPHL